ncbi:MAG: ABC transporter ATP-binding protein [Lapillicoccus sp.]
MSALVGGRRPDRDLIPSAGAPSTLTVDALVRRGEFSLDVAFAVQPGEVLGVLGPNGAGKSTLLRVLAGLTPLAAGSIRLGDEVLDDTATDTFVPPAGRPVGLVFQNYRLFPHLDVRDNVAFAPRTQGLGRREARARADELLSRFDLTALAHRRPAEVSGGQAQRVALARALAATPRLLLLDEPLSALDARTRLDVRTQLRHHLRDFPGPVLIVTHDPLEAMVLADRLLVIEDGRVVQSGPPAAVARRPATQYVARLVGLNLWPGRLGADRRVTLTAGGELTVSPVDGLAPGADVLVALRPSAITIATERPDHTSTRNVWEGTVTGLELLADRVRVQVDGRPSALVDITAAAVAELGISFGQRVWLAAKATETDAYPDTPAQAG